MTYSSIKRGVDIVGGLALILFFLPICMVVVIILLVTLKKNIIVRQTRIGLHGNEFTMYKFRTMHAEVVSYENAPITPVDERVTPIGAWLRRSSLDEVPQLLNVILGSMSLVGPRPEMAYIVKRYTDRERKRLEVKPGLTGLWQISGRKDIPLAKNLAYDIQYVTHQSFLLDLWILAKTIPAVFSGKGAY